MIIAAGPGRILDDGKRESMDVKQGDKVLYDASEGVIGWYIGYDGDGCVSLIDDGRGLLLSIQQR